MKLISAFGEYSSFQHLRSAYLESRNGNEFWLDPTPFGQDDWDRDMLHASEIGGCPRSTAYRLLGMPEKPRSESSRANRNVMFWAGYRFHFLTYSALNWADLLFTHEHPLDLGDGWSGTLDAVIRPDYRKENEILYDMKTVLPTALKYSYDMPKEKDCLQLGVYGTVRPELTGVVEYADRAGSNDPFICEFELAPWVEKAKERMLVFEAMRDDLPKLPPILDARYVGHYKKPRGKPYRELASISYEPSWMCGYCDYHLTKKEGKHGVTQSDSICHPYNEPPETVATFSPGGSVKSIWTGHEAGVEKWLAQNRLKYDIEETSS